MRRAAGIVAVLALVLGAAFATAGAGDPEKPTYKIVFDNASGLVEGADFRVGGVTVGAIERFSVTDRGARAVVEVSVSDNGFGGLRDDARCKIAQQSLIGEYYVECEPGSKGRTLAGGDTLPIERTESPIAFDLVQNVMRRPFRERFSIILSELGAGFAARGEDVNETIRRAIPALGETRRVLKILGDNRRTLRRLARDSGEVLDVLGDRRKDVSRFVTEAGDTAQATAERRKALAATFRRFPGFLREFEPTLAELGTAARAQAPALRDLSAAAPAVTGLLETLPRFAAASDPALRALGRAGVSGRRAAAEAGSTVALLRRLGTLAPEPTKNLAIITSHLDNRDFAVEPDPDSPGGKGYTGLEAILQYPFDQSLAINIFDQRGYILKLNALINECTAITTDEDAKEDPERYKRCSQALGPNQPGITTPDPTETGGGTRAASRRTRRGDDGAGPAGQEPAAGGQAPADAGGGDGAPPVPGLPDLLDRLPDLLGDQRPSRPAAPTAPPVDLLDFLLAP